ncbi:MAG TPA: sulfite exporter TauE/SafE family protein [Steroidobacteraceae bacterium]|nr:sulfite exporter TauE/SafE family protein [Steroidobacteraceae bacterium]
MDLTKAVVAVLVLVNVAFAAGWLAAIRRQGLRGRPQLADAAIGALTTFLDTLGIGSFAPTTALLKFRGKVADELIPGTLNVGLNIAAFIETFLLISVVAVQPLLLAAMVASSAAGAWLGAGVVSRMPRRSIQLFMGVALLLAAGFFAMSNLGAFPAGGIALGLAGWKFPFAVAVSFMLGALMCVGIGNYAPLMILLSLLGMAPIAAYPIMMASDGLLQPVASLGFFRSGRFSHVASLGLTVGSLVGVPAAFSILSYVLKHDSVKPIRWLITFVVVYAAVSMLRSARRERAAARAAASAVSH